ncbi:hypothetical protein V1283_003621 [Bradyrhizobium sp. AZCC 2262]|uniref:hypothetical protein n=1 Tax=Bradyrhizobium sp. AZCC 2262 TaxID=3117022 RepID=UPI002FF19FB5
MKTAFRPARWVWILFLAIIPVRLSAEPGRSLEVLREITLDIDQDGKRDRAVLTRNDDESSYVDLHIYLDDDTDKSDLSRKPSIVKRHLASGHVYEMASSGNGSLRVEVRCGGCSNDYDTVFSIAYRAGDFLVGGLTRSWELRDGRIGSCDVNYLTGKAVASKGLPTRNKVIRTALMPIKLADWSEQKTLRACRP